MRGLKKLTPTPIFQGMQLLSNLKTKISISIHIQHDLTPIIRTLKISSHILDKHHQWSHSALARNYNRCII